MSYWATAVTVLVLVLHRGVVTVSSTGVYTSFKGMTTATSGVIARFPLILPVRNSFASYGTSAVTRTSDRGHVAEASNQGHRSGGVSIRVSKETFLPLNVHRCLVSSIKMLKTVHHDDDPFIVLTETKFSYRYIPVWARYSPHRTRVEAHANLLSP